MADNSNPPQTTSGAVGAATGSPTPSATVYGQAPPATGYPWDQLTQQLDELAIAENQANQAINLAAGRYNEIKDLPVDDTDYPDPGTTSSKALSAALTAYVNASTKLTDVKQEQARTAGQIATAKQAYNDAQDKNQLTPQTIARLNADTDAAKQQALVYGAQAALAQAQADQLTSPEGQAAQAAKTRVDTAQAALIEAQKGQVGANNTLIAAQANESTARGGLIAAQGAAYPAESAAGITHQGAQANAAQAQADATATETEQHRRGALGTFIDQVTATAAAGLITQAEAERQIAAFAQAQATGATPFEWQQQADANARQVSTSMIQSGQMVGAGQQYVAGGEPGGILEQAAARWGFKAPSVQLHPTGAPAYMQSLGMTTGTPQAQGGPAGGPPAYMQSLPGGIPDYSHLSLAEIEALHAAPPAASPSNVQLPATAPAGAQMGGVGGGLALGPIITGAPNYARLPGT
jgi:hypothetical protein